MLGIRYGSGMHESNIPPSSIGPALELNYATLPFYLASLCFTKLSICWFYLRVFTTTNLIRYQIYAVVILLIGYTIPLEILAILSCTPPSKNWEPKKPGICLNTIPAFWTSFVCNLLTDIYLIAFAFPKIWNLQMQKRQKVALLSTVSLGWVVIVAAIIRVVRISAILHATDTTWRAYDSSIWSAVEMNTSLICAAAPALKPLFKRFLPGLMSSLSGRTSKTVNPNSGGLYGSGKNSRSTWMKGSRSRTERIELDSTVRHGDLTSLSQEELARSAGRSEWLPGKLDLGGDDDEVNSEEGARSYEHDGDGIMKSTYVSVSSKPTRGSSAV